MLLLKSVLSFLFFLFFSSMLSYRYYSDIYAMCSRDSKQPIHSCWKNLILEHKGHRRTAFQIPSTRLSPRVILKISIR